MQPQASTHQPRYSPLRQSKHACPLNAIAPIQGDVRAVLAVDMFVYRVRKYVGAYMVALGGRVDAIVFSAGIGENSAIVRRMVCSALEVRTLLWG